MKIGPGKRGVTMTKTDRNALLCWCCHCVRGCERCCKTCKSECNLRHDCEHGIWDATGQNTAKAWEWYHGVSTTLCSSYALSKIPDDIKSRVEKLTSKPIQLELFDL